MGALHFGPARVPSRESPEAAIELLQERGYTACEIDFEGKFWMDYPWAERLGELAREAADVQEWSLDVVAAFMRAAYGKGYCDALTEESPGSLCEEHGYRIPPRRKTVPLHRAA